MKAADPTCVQTVGALRAQRLYRHCNSVNSSINDLCLREASCADTAALSLQLCGRIDANVPAWCQEHESPAIGALVGSELDQARLFARTVHLDLAQAVAAKASANKANGVLAAGLEQLKRQLAAHQKHQADFKKALESGNSDLAQCRNAEANPGAVSLARALQIQARLHALAASAVALAKEHDQIGAAILDLSKPLLEARASKDRAEDALTDLREAKAIISPLVARSKAQRPTDLAAPARALMGQVERDEASTQAALASAAAEKKKAESLRVSGPLADSAQIQFSSARQQLLVDTIVTQSLVSQIDQFVQRAAAQRRSDAPR